MMSCSSTEPSSYCSTPAATELKLYQAFIFSVPVFFTFLFLLLFYVFFLRRRRANWQSMRMRARGENPRLSELGIKKEVREMLPVVVFKESFLIRETQCSVCLGDYKTDERLQRIPPCGHTFHVDCIDHWLATHTTCPLCRVSLLQATKSSTDPPNIGESIAETQLLEQRSESENDVRAVEDTEANCSFQVLGKRSEDEDSRHHGEGSDVVINIESDVNPEENARL